jgi:hypothetical protein
MENEPSIRINLGDKKFEMTRENSFLYTFLGRAALYNHVFLQRDDLPPVEGGQLTGTYIFEDLTRNGNIYARLAQMMQEKDFPQYLNHKEPAQCDMDAYMLAATRDLSDTVPEEWR